ncbi:phosphatidylserine synthase-like [Chironomus tepperi]|uniref:phosphatidylserine synthase-like n=1 Tax=Chironomus tepperi TaxID=113505 RepID=UPI00391FB747
MGEPRTIRSKSEDPIMPPSKVKEFTESFQKMNERAVEDMTLNFFYKPHTITLLLCTVIAAMYFAFTRNDLNTEDNIWAGIVCVIIFFCVISVLAFPNGPFTRPHPAIWRMIFGLSVLYLMFLVFLMFQNYKAIMGIFYWFDPELEDFKINMDKEYGVNCSIVTVQKIYEHIDCFALAHYLGWMFKGILIRHTGILWCISVMWEITEIQFAHLLPNFVECWWDAIILDILLCNGFGIWCGIKLCKILEMREYKWVGLRDISSTSGKLKRAALQFTPESWTAVRWMDPKCTYMRFLSVCQLVIFWQVTELNTFFLKHIFEMPPSHPIVIVRLILIGLFTAPSVRQYYIYSTDTTCKRMGTQCWVYCAVMFAEAILCIKNGKELFSQTQATKVIWWLLIQAVLSIILVLGCMFYHKHFQKSDESESTPRKQKSS